MFRFVDDGWEMLARECVMCASFFRPHLGRTSWSGASVKRTARENHLGGVVRYTLNSQHEQGRDVLSTAWLLISTMPGRARVSWRR
jgi:hypothetical protein